MKFYPTRPQGQFLCFILLSIVLILSCSKDSDLLQDAIFNDANQSIEDREKNKVETTETTEEVEEEAATVSEEVEEETPVVAEDPNALQEGFENRTTSFPPIHDAHFQSGKSYNQHIVRLEEGSRTSYLMFDLGQIDSIGGQITDAKLQFTINSDDGDGTINVYKGQSVDWTENDLSSIPEAGVQIGSIIKQYKIGSTEEIQLQSEHLAPLTETLVLNHEDGNDLAFASKEHPTADGPKLVVSYNVSEDAQEIIFSEEVATNQEQEEETAEEEVEESSASENEAPMAVADGTPTTGQAPLKVTFKGSSSTDDTEIKKYEWNFKDGATSTSANPTHTFDKVGVYEAVLKVTDEEGLTDTDTVTINVNNEENEAPKAVATATPSSGSAPLDVQFKGSDSNDDNGVTGYKWDFKDGTTATNANPSHEFDKAGEYKVTLTVEDENGLSNTKTITITVEEPKQNEAPKAVATATPTSGVAPLEVQFKGGNSSDDDEIASYKWDFKDGSSASSSNPSHSFAKAGTYEVELTVKDAEGLSSKKTVTITVTEPAQNDEPKAVATATPTSGEAPLNVQFKGSNSSDDTGIASYSWDFKDGSNASTSNPSHSFSQPGTYKVELKVTDDDGEIDTETITIDVRAPSYETVNMGSLKAFPGAEGFGKNTTGGRGGIVVEVTNLNDSGSGSFRDALRMGQKRTIVFKVGGTINLREHLVIADGYGDVTIAGQTAPGGGILIKGGELRIQTSNVIVRHLRFRMGSSANSTTGVDCIKIRSYKSQRLQNVILDHCSVSWGKDENISITNAENVTIQNSVIGECDKSFLMQNAKKISVLNNLMALNSSRNVRANTADHTDLTFELINNIIYGFKWATGPTEGMSFNVLGNSYRLSKNVSTATDYCISLASPAPENGDNGNIRTTHAFIEDNVHDSQLGLFRSEIGPYKKSSPKNKSSYQATNANNLDSKLLSHIGASLPRRDAVDSRLIQSYKNRSGSTRSSGSYPSISNGTGYKDSDKDGMSDDWENANGLDRNNKNDGKADRNGDGFTNLEEFLHSLVI